MGALTNLWNSERGLLAVAIIIAATVLAALGQMTVDSWQTFVMGIFITYASAKTVTGAMEIIKGGSKRAPKPAPAQAVPQPAALEPTVPVKP